MDKLYTYANMFDTIRDENYNLWNEENLDSKNAIFTFLNNYLKKIIPEKINLKEAKIKSKNIASKITEHITGDYQIGVGNENFDEICGNVETISSVIAYSNDNELNENLKEENLNEFAQGIADGVVSYGLIPSDKEKEATKNFKSSNENIKKFFKNSLNNIANLNKKVSNIIAHVAKLDSDESKEFNSNITGKMVGGLTYELLSGALMKKRHFTNVTNSKSMQEQIQKEGILHFTSFEGANKIMQSGKIKKSNFLLSDCTKGKSFFFAGVPTFEDLLINIPAYDVMPAVRIRPTEEQISQLKYRALNDRAVVKDGDFEFDINQAEIVYYGLMYDNDKKRIYLGELEQEQVKDFEVSDEVRSAYHYDGKNSTLLENIKLNAYGFYAEYKHHQKLLQMEEVLREKEIKSFRDVNDETLVELSDIEQAYIDTKEETGKRNSMIETIKSKLMRDKQKTQERENDERLY